MRRSVFAISAAVLLISAGAYAMYVRDMRRARARLTGRSKIIETAFGTMEYAELGSGEPILAIHGAAGGFDQGLDMTGPIADLRDGGQRYRLIAPSRFGYLRSALPSGLTTEMQADAYVQLLDSLGIGKTTIVGISAGAWSALQFAIRHPERCTALVLLVPADYLPPGTSIHGGAVTRAIFNSDFAAWAALKLIPFAPGGITRMMLGTDREVIRAASPGERRRVHEILEHLLPVSARYGGMQFDIKTAGARDEVYQTERITCPVMSVSAEDDAFGTATRARYIAAHVPNGRAVIFPTGGHALVGHYADTLREAVSFLRTAQP